MQPASRGIGILYKVSGEYLAGNLGDWDVERIDAISHQIAHYRKEYEARFAIVLGGGNIVRGRSAKGFSREAADTMGMVGTILNALALGDALSKREIPWRIFDPRPMQGVSDPYSLRLARHLWGTGHVLLFSGGAGLPFISTDTIAVIRARELGVNYLMKGTGVDGVYDKDPKVYPDAKFLPSLTYAQALDDPEMKFMDRAAFVLAEEGNLTTLIFHMRVGLGVLEDRGRYTTIRKVEEK